MKAHILRIHVALVLVASISACDNQSSQSALKKDPNGVAFASGGVNDLSPSTLLEALQQNFRLAMSGVLVPKGPMSIPPRENSAGIECEPAVLHGKSTNLQITLPYRSSQRPAVLAAIAPDGSLRIVYKSYAPDTDVDSIIIPSRTIDWESIKSKRVFRVNVRSFEALVPDADAPSKLFHQAGIYQLGLLDGFPYSIPARNERPFNVIAGCVVHWRP